MSEYVLEKKEVIRHHEFDRERCRHSLNGFQTVLHCHHYMTLTTQMAEDADDLCNGTEVLISTMEDTIYKVLKNYYDTNNITDLWEKVSIAEQYYTLCGLGQIQWQHAGEFSGWVKVLHSHVDEGWKKKWSQRNKPVNYIGRGFIQAAMALFNDKQPRSYRSEETKSIVCGDNYGEIRVWLN